MEPMFICKNSFVSLASPDLTVSPHCLSLPLSLPSPPSPPLSTNRDDQSAFTFLINEYFSHGSTDRRQLYLNSYVGSFWRQSATMAELLPALGNCSSFSRKVHKVPRGFLRAFG
jgi:hypothetical protein